MSWNVNFVGEPQAIMEAIEAYGQGLDGMSKEEFEEVAPGLKALLKANASPYPQVLHLEASGHAHVHQEQRTSSAFVTLKPLGATLVSMENDE